MKDKSKQFKQPDPPIVPPPSENVSTENTGPSPIIISEKPNAS
jgi:hypothetical protein